MEHKNITSEKPNNKAYDNEKDVERALVLGVEKRGGMCIKMLCNLQTGLPDRLVLLKDKSPVFVELKSTGKKPRRMQTIVHRQISQLGIQVYVFDTIKQVNDFLAAYDAVGE